MHHQVTGKGCAFSLIARQAGNPHDLTAGSYQIRPVDGGIETVVESAFHGEARMWSAIDIYVDCSWLSKKSRAVPNPDRKSLSRSCERNGKADAASMIQAHKPIARVSVADHRVCDRRRSSILSGESGERVVPAGLAAPIVTKNPFARP
jgi:hypothetical protein